MACKRIPFFILFLFSGAASFAQLQVFTPVDAQALAQKLVGKGVVVSNAVLKGHSEASGTFIRKGFTNLSIDSGVVLSTGRVQSGVGLYGVNSNATNHASTAFSFDGDADLDALVSPSITYDAVALEFDFVPIGDSISFRYVFSSEEYPEFICTDYNDVFAFFISGPGIPVPRNIALIPGSSIPVAINSINTGKVDPAAGGDIANCNAMGPGSPFPQFFVNNSSNLYFSHNGHTILLTAGAAVVPCQTYHLKIVISDVGDHIYDSGVFLEAGSLKSEPLRVASSLPMLNGSPYLVEDCQSGRLQISRATKAPFPAQVNLTFSGTVINGTDIHTIPSTVTIPPGDSVVGLPLLPLMDLEKEGIEILKIYISSACAAAGGDYADSITIYLRDDLVRAYAGRDTAVAIGQPLQLNGLDLTSAASIWQWQPTSGLSAPDSASPVALLTGDITYTFTASTPSGCTDSDEIRIRVFNAPALFVPSGFTPDGNGRNDLLKVIPVGLTRLNYFRVFDRWGKLIYQVSDATTGWDGTVNGKPQPSGTYVWMAEGVDYKGTVLFGKGTATLIR